jgi:DNA-binding IclR family transcriptional regulator
LELEYVDHQHSISGCFASAGKRGSTVRERKLPGARLRYDKWPASLLSHDVLTPDTTIKLSPFARVRERGQSETVAKSAMRSLDILELLARVGKPLRAVEIASVLELSPSSTHQVLKTMMDAAYLIFDPASKRYHPSIRATSFGGALAGCKFEPGAMDRLIKALHAELGSPVTISASQGRFMQIIDVFEPPGADSASRPTALRQESVGLRVPIFGSCTGAAWLSAQTDEMVLSTAWLCRRALGEKATDSEHILGIVRRVRQQGYGFGGVSPDDLTRAVAVPLPPDRYGTIDVITVSAPAEEMGERRDAIARLLKEQVARHLAPAS